ncbi:MAG: hypothetical protein PHU78_10475 [Heliobacteriaceae bacterium]|nr:hypothetical protein [Heliobacteriaceae bacterium]
MLKQEQFEQLIKSALQTKAEKTTPPAGMKTKVRNALLTGKKTSALRSNWILTWKKAVAAAACLTFLGGGISLVFSPGLQAWANERVNDLINRLHVVTHTEEVDGGVLSSMEFKFQDSAAEQAARDTIERNRAKATSLVSYEPYPTLAEAEKEAGFRIKVPTYFPDGYGLKNIWVHQYFKDQDGESVATGKHDVSMRFDGGNDDSPQRLVYSVSENGMEFKPGFRYEEIKIGDREARWYESEITLNENGHNPQQIIERAISWAEADSGMTYLLNDSTGLSKQELEGIVESIR